jgi:serine/threonine-protein kinase RsbW
MKTISTEIASVKKNYRLIEGLLQEANKDFCCPEERFRNVLIAVSELVMNAIVHANKENVDKKVKVIVEYDEKEMKIRILDEGNGFKFGEVADPTIPENILKESGRGIYIVKSLIKEIEHKDTGKGTEFVITIRKKEKQ